MHANYQKMSLTKSSQNVTKSPCFIPPVATHPLGSEKSTASPSWTPRAGPRKRREFRLESRAAQRRSRFHPSTFILHPFLHPLPIQNPTFKIQNFLIPPFPLLQFLRHLFHNKGINAARTYDSKPNIHHSKFSFPHLTFVLGATRNSNFE